MPAVTLLFYREKEEIPALDWLDGQPVQAQDRCAAALILLSRFGHELRRPHVENIGQGLYELRVPVGRQNFRFLFSYFGRQVVVVSHGFTKERRIPEIEVERAGSRKCSFEEDPTSHSVEVEV